MDHRISSAGNNPQGSLTPALSSHGSPFRQKLLRVGLFARLEHDTNISLKKALDNLYLNLGERNWSCKQKSIP